MKVTKIELSDAAAGWVGKQVASGRFASEAELFEAALQVLAAWEAGEIEKLAALRRDVEAGLADIEAGLVEDWDVESIEAEGRRRLALQTSQA